MKLSRCHCLFKLVVWTGWWPVCFHRRIHPCTRANIVNQLLRQQHSFFGRSHYNNVTISLCWTFSRDSLTLQQALWPTVNLVWGWSHTWRYVTCLIWLGLRVVCIRSNGMIQCAKHAVSHHPRKNIYRNSCYMSGGVVSYMVDWIAIL